MNNGESRAPGNGTPQEARAAEAEGIEPIFSDESSGHSSAVLPGGSNVSREADVLAVNSPLAGSALGFLKRPTLLDDRDSGSTWDEAEKRKAKRTNPVVRAFGFIGLGLASFCFFLYLTFPYGVIKEVVVSSVSDSLRKSGIPVRISIGSLRPHWFTGIRVKDVRIANAADPDATLKIVEATLRLNVLPLLWGSATVTGHLTQAGGDMDVRATLPIIGAINGNQSPSSARIEFQSFALDPFFNHVLAVARASKDPSLVLVLPLLAKTTAGGMLSGSVTLDNSDTANFVHAKGEVKLDIKDAFLHIDDATLKIPKQTFSDARIGLKFENNAILVNGTKLKAEDIGLGLDGKVTLADSPAGTMTADLDMALSMHGEIEKNLGFIIPNMMRCKPLASGELKAKLTGPVTQMRCD
jgi:type II secretion system protein N